MQFTQRKSAEKAAEGTFNKLLIKGNKITIRLRSGVSLRSQSWSNFTSGGASLRARLQDPQTLEWDRYQYSNFRKYAHPLM